VSYISQKKLPLIALLIPLTFYLGSIVFLYILPFDKVIDSQLLALSVVDYVFTLIVVILLFISNKREFLEIDIIFQTKYKKNIDKYYILFLLLVGYSLSATYTNLNLIIFSGYNREGLLNSISAGYLDMLLPTIFSCLLVISIIYKYSRKIKLLMFIGTVSTMLFYLSRSNLLFIITFPIAFLFIRPFNLNYHKILRLIPVVLGVVLFASYITILQGRDDDLFAVFYKIIETLFRYKAYSFYLAEYAINAANDFEKVLFPFFGFFSEKILSLVWYIETPIAVNGSEFVFEFHDLGSGYRANVLYPWWAWFYGSFGVAGLLLKSGYIYMILSVILKLRLPLTFMYLLFLVLFSISVKHPVINAASFYGIFVLILFDIVMKVRFSGKNSNN
jgi:hypothetical protein